MKFSPQPTFKLGRAAALALAVAGIVGCDPVASSNKDVVSGINDGLAKLGKADGYRPVDVVNAARQSLVTAAGDKGADPGHLAVAAGAVAYLDQGVGQSQFATFFSNVSDARQTLAQLRQLASQVSLVNTLATGQKKADPRDAQTKIADQIRAMQGDAQAATWGGQGATLPTLAAVKQEESRLQGVVAEQQQKVADLTKQRADAIATSETQLKHADSLKGDEAVKAFADGSESRRKADDLAIQIDLENDKLTRAQADLAVQQGQEAAINNGIAGLTAQSKQLDTAWTDTQQRAADQGKIASNAVTAEGDKAYSIKALSATLVKQLAAVQTARSAAVDQFSEADKYFGNARDNAQKLIQSYSDRINSNAKDVKNYKSLKDSLLPVQYTLQIGVVRRDAGTVVAAEAALLQEVATTKAIVAAALEPAGLQVPADLAGIDPNGAKTLADDAYSRLDDANKALSALEGGESLKTLQTSAKVARLITLNALIQLADVKTKLGDTDAKAAASQYHSDASGLKDDIISSGGHLPALPGDLGVAPAAPAPAPVPVVPTAPEAGNGPAAAAPASPAPSSGDAKTAFGDFSLHVPSGWMQTKPDRDKTAAMLVPLNSTPTQVSGFIKVDTGTPETPNARDLATSLAGSNGKVEDTPVMLDGVEAVKVTTAANDLSRPQIALIAFRAGKVYMLMGAGLPGTDVAEPMDTIIKSWSWAN